MSRRDLVRRWRGSLPFAALSGCATPLAVAPAVAKERRIGFLSANNSLTDQPYIEIR